MPKKYDIEKIKQNIKFLGKQIGMEGARGDGIRLEIPVNTENVNTFGRNHICHSVNQILIWIYAYNAMKLPTERGRERESYIENI